MTKHTILSTILFPPLLTNTNTDNVNYYFPIFQNNVKQDFDVGPTVKYFSEWSYATPKKSCFFFKIWVLWSLIIPYSKIEKQIWYFIYWQLYAWSPILESFLQCFCENLTRSKSNWLVWLFMGNFPRISAFYCPSSHFGSLDQKKISNKKKHKNSWIWIQDIATATDGYPPSQFV